MRIKKAMTYWIYSFLLSLITVVCVQELILKDYYQLNYIGGFVLSAIVDFLIIIGLYDNIPSQRLKDRLEKIKKIFEDNTQIKT